MQHSLFEKGMKLKYGKTIQRKNMSYIWLDIMPDPNLPNLFSFLHLKDYHWSGESESTSVWFSQNPLPFPFPDLFIVRFFNGFLGRAQGLGRFEETAVWLGPGLIVDLLPLFRRNLADFCATKSIANLDTRCICRFNIIKSPCSYAIAVRPSLHSPSSLGHHWP